VSNNLTCRVTSNLLFYVTHLRLCLLQERAREAYPTTYDQIWEQDVLLTYTKDEKTYEICDIHQTFQTLRVVNSWITSGMKGSLDVCFIPLVSVCGSEY